MSYRNENLIETIRPGNANILLFSDGGFWEDEGLASAAWVAYVLGGHWGDDDGVVHLLATEGVFIESNATSFLAEMMAAESALSFMHSLTV